MANILLVGVGLGILIGILTGAVFITFLRTLATTSPNLWSRILTVAGEILAIPTLWFGVPWVTTTVLKGVKWEEVRGLYVSTLAITFLLISLFPLARFIIRMTNEIRGGRGNGDA